MAENRVCIDTDVIIDFLRKKSPGREIFKKCLKQYECYITFVTGFEIYLGMKSDKQRTTFEIISEQLKLLPIDIEAVKKSAEVVKELRKKNQEIGLMDSIIAGICINNNIELETKNVKHFNRVKELELYRI